ncbi:GXWXG domain-containing protein [Rhizobium sp. NPDC090275]|uniref:GXWXG domain-containing protein n=1 Tax=Rhizobium sp. NPDC090275 TaxID=3364498 RepID=UPI00383B132C
MSGGLQSDKIAWFASLPPVMPAELIGVWCGEGIPSGHPLDGVLENLQWFGKKFHPDFRADALLFQWRPGRLVPAEPSFFPIRTVIHLSKLVRARDTTAFVTLRSFGEDQTAAMVYDRQPIADFFRRVGDDEIAGMMVVEGDQRRYFFRLRRVDASDEKARP